MQTHPMHRFVIEQLAALAPPDARVLDFGCGGGDLVEAGRDAGLHITGADIFFGGSNARGQAQATGALGSQVFEMQNGRLPFPDNSFDLVCANQVFEHVDNLDLALAEIDRVLGPGGAFLNIFPSVGVIREGHCGVPMAHWLQQWPGLQRAYLRLARHLGLGYFKNSRSCKEWAAQMGDYLQRFTVYRRERALLAAHRRHFPLLRREEDAFAAFRLRPHPLLAATVRHRLVRPLTRIAICSLGSMVIVARRAP